ncbi:hypothetical protein ACQ4PT_048211 [Festuca glaucescens]
MSLYADDVVVFAKPSKMEAMAIRDILECFGSASGLLVNYAKSSTAPIRCDDHLVQEVTSVLRCPVAVLPCKYLGLPLSLSKLRKQEVQPILDRLANKLSSWKAKLLSKDGRVVFVQVIMTSSLIYPLLALDLDLWVLKFVDKLRRGFLWTGSEDARGGSCLVAWNQVCQPKHLDGLGFHNLKFLNAALRAKWLWAQKAEGDRPWAGLDIAVSPLAQAIFDSSISISVGSGEGLLFWEDPWIGGLTAGCIAPKVLAMVRRCVVKRLSVRDGIAANSWARGISGELTVDATVQYLKLWSAVAQVANGDKPDMWRWKWRADGCFSAKPA